MVKLFRMYSNLCDHNPPTLQTTRRHAIVATLPCEMFQQDSAPAHRARETIKLLQWETPAFISPDLWPPNSPNLNPVNYKICGVMQDRVYQEKVKDVNELRERLVEVWGRTATWERDWWCHRPVSQTDACVPALGLEESICCDWLH